MEIEFVAIQVSFMMRCIKIGSHTKYIFEWITSTYVWVILPRADIHVHSKVRRGWNKEITLTLDAGTILVHSGHQRSCAGA